MKLFNSQYSQVVMMVTGMLVIASVLWLIDDYRRSKSGIATAEVHNPDGQERHQFRLDDRHKRYIYQGNPALDTEFQDVRVSGSHDNSGHGTANMYGNRNILGNK